MELKLELGEVLCSKCKGETFIRYTEKRGNGFYPMKQICDKCKGHGKLDWIENITGIKKPSKRVWPDLYDYAISWGWDEDEEDTNKKSYQDIQYSINPKFKKQLERKIIRNMNRVKR